MSHLAIRRQEGFGKRVHRFFSYLKAKKLASEINRDMAFFEAKYLKSRIHHT